MICVPYERERRAKARYGRRSSVPIVETVHFWSRATHLFSNSRMDHDDDPGPPAVYVARSPQTAVRLRVGGLLHVYVKLSPLTPYRTHMYMYM